MRAATAHRLAPDFRDKTAGFAVWFARHPVQGCLPCLLTLVPASRVPTVGPPIYLELPRSRSARRLSRRRFLTGLFIFEEGSRKMRRRGSTNALLFKDIQTQCEDYNGTRIAFIRTICPLKIVRNRTEAKSGAKWLREPLRIFQ